MCNHAVCEFGSKYEIQQLAQMKHKDPMWIITKNEILHKNRHSSDHICTAFIEGDNTEENVCKRFIIGGRLLLSLMIVPDAKTVHLPCAGDPCMETFRLPSDRLTTSTGGTGNCWLLDESVNTIFEYIHTNKCVLENGRIYDLPWTQSAVDGRATHSAGTESSVYDVMTYQVRCTQVWRWWRRPVS